MCYFTSYLTRITCNVLPPKLVITYGLTWKISLSFEQISLSVNYKFYHIVGHYLYLLWFVHLRYNLFVFLTITINASTKIVNVSNLRPYFVNDTDYSDQFHLSKCLSLGFTQSHCLLQFLPPRETALQTCDMDTEPVAHLSGNWVHSWWLCLSGLLTQEGTKAILFLGRSEWLINSTDLNRCHVYVPQVQRANCCRGP